MAGFSSDASYKQNSPSKASILGELHEAQRTIRRLEMEVQQARPSPSIHDGHHSHRPSSRASSNDFGREEEHRRRRNPPQFHGQRPHHQGERHHYDNGFYQDAKSRLPSVKLPCFNRSSDPNVYLDWEAKGEQIFEIHEIQDEHKLKLGNRKTSLQREQPPLLTGLFLLTKSNTQKLPFPKPVGLYLKTNHTPLTTNRSLNGS